MWLDWDEGWRVMVSMPGAKAHTGIDGREVWSANLERRDVGMGHVAVHILDLGQVLLGYVHELRGAHLVGEPRESLVKRRRVVFLVMVLL